MDITPLREAVLDRERVLSVVSHDLKSPLSAIIISATMLLRGSAPEDQRAPRVRGSAETILRSARRMMRFIDDLLDFSSIEAGRLSMRPAPEHPAELLDDVLAEWEGPAKEKGIALRCEVAPLISSVRCDRDRVAQIFANLLGNALHATPAGGAIAVRAREAERDICFSVSDSGPGIAESELPYVFERYWRGQGLAYRGAGLGLAITKGLVSAHGGRLWVESQPGRGTTFYFTLPVAGEDEMNRPGE